MPVRVGALFVAIGHVAAQSSQSPPSQAFLSTTTQQAILATSSIADESSQKISSKMAIQDGFPILQTLQNFMPEEGAIALTKWSYLSRSFSDLGEKAKLVLQVREDLANMENDVSEQQRLWSKGEVELRREVQGLEHELENWKQKTEDGMKWMHLNGTNDQAFLEAKNEYDKLDQEQSDRTASWQKDLDVLNQRIAVLEARERGEWQTAQDASASLLLEDKKYEEVNGNDTALIESEKFQYSDLQKEIEVEKGDNKTVVMTQKFNRMRDTLLSEIKALQRETAVPVSEIAAQIADVDKEIQLIQDKFEKVKREYDTKVCWGEELSDLSTTAKGNGTSTQEATTKSANTNAPANTSTNAPANTNAPTTTSSSFIQVEQMAQAGPFPIVALGGGLGTAAAMADAASKKEMGEDRERTPEDLAAVLSVTAFGQKYLEMNTDAEKTRDTVDKYCAAANAAQRTVQDKLNKHNCAVDLY